MKFAVKTEKPVVIEIDVNGKIHKIDFYPTDLATRQAFYEIYEELKAYKVKETAPIVDANGVSNKDLLEVSELKRFTEFFAERFDRVFGSGTAAIIMDGRCNPSELICFTCEMAQYFKSASEKLIGEYTAPESGVMK